MLFDMNSTCWCHCFFSYQLFRLKLQIFWTLFKKVVLATGIDSIIETFELNLKQDKGAFLNWFWFVYRIQSVATPMVSRCSSVVYKNTKKYVIFMVYLFRVCSFHYFNSGTRYIILFFHILTEFWKSYW